MDKRDTTGHGYLWEVDSPPITPTRHIEFTAYDGTNALTVKSNPILDNAFHHVAVTLDRGANSLSIYVDGILNESADATGLGTLDNATRLFIGRGTLDTPTGAQPFMGAVDELTLYDRALTSSEIEDIYDAGSDGKCP